MEDFYHDRACPVESGPGEVMRRLPAFRDRRMIALALGRVERSLI